MTVTTKSQAFNLWTKLNAIRGTTNLKFYRGRAFDTPTFGYNTILQSSTENYDLSHDSHHRWVRSTVGTGVLSQVSRFLLPWEDFYNLINLGKSWEGVVKS